MGKKRKSHTALPFIMGRYDNTKLSTHHVMFFFFFENTGSVLGLAEMDPLLTVIIVVRVLLLCCTTRG
jgi:hypothetical protein